MDKKQLINEVIEYIISHLNDDLTLDRVAERFHFSKYYFSRMFKEETGESVYAFIKRCKMDQSAVDIKLKRAKSIIEIGMDYGYTSSNYSSVFRQHHMVSPAMFRRENTAGSVQIPFDTGRTAHFKAFEVYAANIKVQAISDFFVVYERYIGSYVDLEQNWYRFIGKYQMLLSEQALLLERFYDDPLITRTDQCICDLCITVPPECTLKNKVLIGGGRWAVYHFEGAVTDIFEELQGVFSVWFPGSGYEMSRRYGLNIYRSIDRDNSRVVMDFCIPIQEGKNSEDY